MPVQGQVFKRLFVTDTVGTKTELTAYAQKITGVIDNQIADITTFRAGGYAATSNNIHGAILGSIAVTFVYDPAVTYVIRQLVGARSGFLVQCYNGQNAAPTAGDEVFQLTATLLAPTWGYQTSQVSTIQTTFVPADGGSVAQGFAVL